MSWISVTQSFDGNKLHNTDTYSVLRVGSNIHLFSKLNFVDQINFSSTNPNNNNFHRKINFVRGVFSRFLSTLVDHVFKSTDEKPQLLETIRTDPETLKRYQYLLRSLYRCRSPKCQTALDGSKS